MRSELLQAREVLRKKLMQNADFVIREVLKTDPKDLIEIGLFGSVVKNNFTCNSDSDIYLLFDKYIPDRVTKGYLRSIAEENNCDIVFIKSEELMGSNASLLAENILENRIILWRKGSDD